MDKKIFKKINFQLLFFSERLTPDKPFFKSFKFFDWMVSFYCLPSPLYMQTQTFDDCFSGCLECSDNIHKNYKKYIVYFFFFELVAFLVRGVKKIYSKA